MVTQARQSDCPGPRAWRGENRSAPATCRRFRIGAPALCGFLFIVLFAGCGKTNPPDADENTKPVPKEIVRETTRGPVTLSLRLDRDELSIAERLQLSLTVDADEAYEVQLPKVGDKLDQFGIVDYSTSQPQLLDGGKVRTVRTYVLEPFLSGDYTIPPMTVIFSRKEGAEKDGAEEDEHSVETEAVTVKVTSLLPEESAALDVEDIEGPLAPPPPSLTWLWLTLAGIAAALAVTFAIGYGLRRRRGALAPVVRIPPHEVAYSDLRALIEADLVEKGLIKEFYQRLSDILRRYIENRFGLHAPERTTEEFLFELGKTDVLNGDQKGLLKVFLTHCDLVKFAELAPGTSEIQSTFDSCKAFIEQTREVAA